MPVDVFELFPPVRGRWLTGGRRKGEPLNDRIKRLRNRLEEQSDRAIFLERMLLLEEAFQMFRLESAGRRYALAFAHVLSKLTVEIHSDELIVGGVREVVPDAEQERLFLRQAALNDFSAAELFSFDPLGVVPIREIPPRYAPSWFHSWGHLTPAWEKLLARGLGGILEEARERMRTAGSGTAEAARRREFYENILIVGEAMVGYARRHAAAARAQADTESDPGRRSELLQIARICEKVPAEPAATLAEGLQSIWFIYLVLHCVCGARDYALGRFDQYMYPLFRQAGAEEGREWLQCFFIKLNEIIGRGVESYTPKRILSVNSLQYLIIGGQDENGQDVSNELSQMVLEAVGELRLKQPTVVVRVHKGLDSRLFAAACRLAQQGLGYPSFFNDHVLIRAFRDVGVSESDAINYVHYGCNNANVAAKEDELREAWHNLPKYLELALNEGRCLLTGRKLSVATKPIEAMSSFPELFDAFRAQVRHGARLAAERIRENDRIWREHKPFSFESLFVDDCLERGRDLTDEGPAYRHMNNHAVGLATVANALFAIRKLVFEDHRLSLEQLRQVLRSNFRGYEALREEILQLPKFGNDLGCVDAIAVRVADLFVEEIRAIPLTVSGGRALWPTFYSLWHHRELGKHTAASADGRLEGTPVSENQSPVYDTERRGPTAALNSIARLPFTCTPGGGLNVKLQAGFLQGEKGATILQGLIRGYFRRGGMQVQINLLDRAMLVEAKAHPEQYQNLMVRVVGYSAYFVTLSPEQQDEIIARTEHSRPA